MRNTIINQTRDVVKPSQVKKIKGGSIMFEEEKTAAQNVRQSKETIIDEIIKIMARENLTIEEANRMLHKISIKINQQLVQESL